MFAIPSTFVHTGTDGAVHGTYLVTGSLASQLINRISENKSSEKIYTYNNFGNICGRTDKNIKYDGSFTLTYKTSAMFTSSVADSFTLQILSGGISASVLINDVAIDLEQNSLVTATYNYEYLPFVTI